MEKRKDLDIFCTSTFITVYYNLIFVTFYEILLIILCYVSRMENLEHISVLMLWKYVFIMQR